MKWLRRCLWLIALCSLLLALAWLFRAPLLTGLADLWIVSQPPRKADAVVVLGGGVERIVEAARLYRDGFAPRILIMKTRPNAAVELGATIPDVEVTRKLLLKEGVLEDAVLPVGDGVLSTRDEALAVRDWAKARGRTRLIIPTDLFHTRRVSWLFHKTLQGTTVEVQVTAVRPREYRASDWWQHEEGLIAFQNEIIKYAYYRVRY